MTKQEFLKYVNEMLPKDKQISCITDSECSVIESVYVMLALQQDMDIIKNGGWL